MEKNQEIDFVVTWVDGADENWRKEKALYRPESEADDRPERYRDWDFMKYWFRGVEKFAPWVRKVHFVTWGHLPKWLNTDNPKLNIVNHKDFIPEEYLPTFNCNAIEVNLHRIKGLSENFVYFNDDVFLIKDASPRDFFIDGKPRDMLALQPIALYPENFVMSHILLNNLLVISKHFNKWECVRRHPLKYYKIGYPLLCFLHNFTDLAVRSFTGFYTVHGPFPFCKETYVELWDKEYDVLSKTSSNKFRSSEDVTTYLIREWKKLKGEFVPTNLLRRFKYYDISSNNEKLINDIKRQKLSSICINDAYSRIDFESARAEISSAFEAILPQKCSFEL